MKNFRTAVAIILTAITVISLSSCLKYTSNILEVTTRPNQGNQIIPGAENTTTIYITENTTAQNVIPQQPEVITTLPQQIPSENTTAAESTTSSLIPQPEETTAAAAKDPSTWTTAEILSYTSDAVAKTKAYTSSVTVDHAEAFSANITKAPGGAMVKNIANGIIQSVVAPTDEVLTFNGGTTVNGEGETVPLLLPKRGAFTLTVDGIASATAKKSGNDVVIKIVLVEELGTLTDHPKHQAASVGYLDASDVDLGPVTLNYLDITYIGTSIELTVNSDGYVKDAIYKIPIEIQCEGSVMGATAQIEVEGEQSETWKINW